MLLFVILIYTSSAAAYTVSGVVEFSYRSYETQVGGKTTSSTQDFIQNYRLRLSSPVWDPRFLNLNAGVGYTVMNSSSKYSNSDSTVLTYDITATFFPGMRFNWDLFGSKTVTSVNSNTNIAGSEIQTTRYGGVIHYRPLSSTGNNNRSFNNNNDNVSGTPSIFNALLPVTRLSYAHTEAQSSNSAALHETRDDAKIELGYVMKNSSLEMEGAIEKYDNLATTATYDTKRALVAYKQFLTTGELRFRSELLDTKTENVAGFAQSRTLNNTGVNLDFNRQGDIRHYYGYTYSQEKIGNAESTSNAVSGNVDYRVIPEVTLRLGADYRVLDRTVSGPTTTSETAKTADINAGIGYFKTYTPSFLGPFSFTTAYDFQSGYTNYTSEPAVNNGSGYFYGNVLALALQSTGWKQENLTADYLYSNRRDHSPVQNDMMMQQYRLNVTTRRIPDTEVNGNVSYVVRETSSTSTLLVPVNAANNSRGLNYQATITYSVTYYLTAQAGASRGQSTNTTSSLFNLTPTATVVTSQDKMYYGQFDYKYMITRNLSYHANLRDEWRESSSVRSQNYQFNTDFSYRLRMIFLSGEYRWKQDNYDRSPSTVQQYYFVKLSRPF